MSIKPIIIQNRVIIVILVSLVFMKIMPFGSFSFLSLGTYPCIMLAIILEACGRWLIYKYLVKEDIEDVENQTFDTL